MKIVSWEPLKAFYKEQIEEISEDSNLRIYGFCLLAVHFFTGLFWQRQDMTSILLSLNEGACFPIFSSCEDFRKVLSPILHLLFPFYILLSVLSIVLFTLKSEKIWRWLFSLEVLKLFLQSLDYHFMGNYHYMPHVITMVYLFSSRKKFWISIWIVSFYFAAATLKLNAEWLSGAGLSWKIPFGRPEFLIVGAMLALVVEVTAPQLLFFPRKAFRWLGFGLLAIFHLISFYWVGFFYPSVMLCLLALFAMEISKSDSDKLLDIRKDSIFSAMKSYKFLVTFLVWLGFWYFQIQSLQDYRIAALGGKERLLSLNMFDARAYCKGVFYIHKKNQIVEVNFSNQDLGARVKCDPIVFEEQAKHLCQLKDSQTERIDIFLTSKLSTDSRGTEIVREQDFCKKWL